MKDIRGANAILTGASRGIGTYIARALATEGVNVALAARSADKLEETRRACEALGVKALAVACDVTSRDDLRRLVQTAERELGAIDILVNNAGIEITAPFPDHSFDQIDGLLRTNLNAPLWLTKMVLPGMIGRNRGAIVNISSMAGKGPSPYDAVYATSKAGLNGFTYSLTSELDGTGVTAGVVCPGFVSDAGMWADHGQKAPWSMREVSPAKVARAALKVIRGSREELVTAGPIRPLLALGQMMPGMTNSVVKRMGIARIFREEAERLQQGEDRPRADTAAAPPREPLEAATRE